MLDLDQLTRDLNSTFCITKCVVTGDEGGGNDEDMCDRIVSDRGSATVQDLADGVSVGTSSSGPPPHSHVHAAKTISALKESESQREHVRPSTTEDTDDTDDTSTSSV